MSSQSTLPLFGRRYTLTITTTGQDVITVSSDAWEPEALRFTFEISCSAMADRWLANIEITNLNFATTGIIVNQGSTVEIQAGYQQGQNYGLIWSGKVLWCEFTKRNVVDHVLTIQSVTGMEQLVNNFVSMATGPFQTQSQLMLAMAQNANTPFTILDPGNTLDGETTGQLPTPKLFFGQPKHYLKDACRQANTYFFPDFAGNINILSLKVLSNQPQIIYASPIPAGSTATPDPSVSYSIVGTPKQTLISDQLWGVAFKVLLDSRCLITNPPMLIKIDNSTLIEQSPVSFGTPPPVLAQSGTYAIVAVEHIGDTRGNEWYTEVAAVNLIGEQLGIPSSEGKDNRYISVNQGENNEN